MKKLHAYFENMCEARNATAALTQAGFNKAHLDLAGTLDYEYSEEISSTKTSQSTAEGSDNLSAIMMSLWSKGLYDTRATVANAGTQISKAGCEEGELKISTRLSLNVPDESANAAFKIINDNGGRIFSSFME